jgi:1-acyl-sn-glycerol-3-phosphate acyltransferase
MTKNEIVPVEKRENKFYSKIKRFFAGLFKRLLRITIVNPENEPTDKSYIVCCNHTALLDVVVIAAGLKRQVSFMAKKEAFKVPILSWFIKSMGAFPVDRKGGDVGAIKKTIEILNGGSCVGIFPQGTRCPYKNPRETEIKDGIGMVAKRAGVGILPVAIKTKKGKVKLFRRTELIIGEYIPLEKLMLEGTNKEQYETITKTAFNETCKLLESDATKLLK